MKEIITIGHVRGFIDSDGTAKLNAEDVARGWGFTQEKSGKSYVKWERVNGYLADFGFSPLVGKDDYLPENMVYRLGFKASNEAAQKFQAELADNVLPTLRKTGSYTTRKIDSAANDKKLEIQKKRVETMAMNANTKRAKVMADLAKVAVLPSYQNTLIVSAANILAGKQIIALPTSESGRERHPLGWYCKLVGKKESWATQMGKILKQHGVDKIHGKTGELVEFVDDGKHQRQTFEWYTDYLMPIVKKNFSSCEEGLDCN